MLTSCSALEESLLKSLEGRDEQDLHFDFDESCIEKCVQTGIRVMSDIAPINYEMKLRIGKNEVTCFPGEVIFFDMDNAHGECSYDITCYRLFMKFGYYIISDNKNDDPVGLVHICKHCKHSNKNLNTLRSHILFCDKNPDGQENRKKRSATRKKEKN